MDSGVVISKGTSVVPTILELFYDQKVFVLILQLGANIYLLLVWFR